VSVGAGCARGAGTEAAALLAAATRPFRNGPLTKAGRELTRHLNIAGQPGNIRQTLSGARGVNAAALEALEQIMTNGIRMSKSTTAYGDVIDFKLPSGLGARFSVETGESIGFLGRNL
jgi:hypothetical protein